MSAPEPTDGSDLMAKIDRLADASGRYRTEAYLWVLRILEATRNRLGRTGHISGRELLEGNRLLASDHFGLMAIDVLRHWGIGSTEDIGHLVFELIEAEILHKTDEDSLDDFTSGYDFEQVFVQDFRW